MDKICYTTPYNKNAKWILATMYLDSEYMSEYMLVFPILFLCVSVCVRRQIDQIALKKLYDAIY